MTTRGNEASEQQEFLNVKNQIYNLKDLMKQNEIKGNSISHSSCVFFPRYMGIHSFGSSMSSKSIESAHSDGAPFCLTFFAILLTLARPKPFHVARKWHCKYMRIVSSFWCLYSLQPPPPSSSSTNPFSSASLKIMSHRQRIPFALQPISIFCSVN